MKHRIVLSALALSLLSTAALAQYAPPPGADGSYCREFTQPVRIGGVTRTAYGTSCQQPDGSWQIVQQPTIQPPNQYAQQPAGAPYYDPAAVGYYGQPYYPAYYGYPYGYAPVGLSFGFVDYHGGRGWHGGGGHWHH